MSHYYPKHNPRDGWPLDLEEINENFRGAVNELHGSLDEHNFQKDGITNLSHMEADAVCRI